MAPGRPGLLQMAVMAAIVATLLYPPLGIVLWLLLGLLGVPLEAFVTFGGAIGLYAGMLAWWLVAFALALTYAVFVCVAET